ncbi:MAG: metallophosphoesterase [Lachnospiraceae bacterium]|nr:metallophosphoesterase [Lachnospiraceae bacterium]
MKFIHCADLHLDSKMSANLDKESAKERKGEILHTFERMVAYAFRNDITAILIAGDMFDTKNISATTRNTVLYHINEHADMTFYYLKGNHDNDNFLSGLEKIPDNLKMFGSNWTTYSEADGKISVSGIELSAENAGAAYVSLVLDSNKFNIVMLHGQESEGAAKDKAEIINLKALRNKGIDYLALGHIHTYKKEQLDARGIYCYSGCLEGRGFDECGEHGFAVIDVDEETGRYTHEFIPFAQRKLYTVSVDVTGCQTTAEMVSRAAGRLREVRCEDDSLVKIVLVGMLDVECEKDIDYLLSGFRNRFYFVKVYDETTLKIDIEDYMLDESLKGEYVRQVMADASIPEEDKKIIIRYGLQAIAGEEVQ